MSHACSLKGKNTPPPEIKYHARYLESLCEGNQKRRSRSQRLAYPVKDLDGIQGILALQRHHTVLTPLKCPHLDENSLNLILIGVSRVKNVFF